jgi:hypothetical protein
VILFGRGVPSEEQTGGFTESPLEMDIADLAVLGALFFAGRVPSVRGTDPGSSPEVTHLGHALNTYSF